MITPKENYLRVLRHERPEWLPHNREDRNFYVPLMGIERWPGTGSGRDGFGVEWTFDAGSGAPMPTAGKILMDDVTKWREQVRFPDLDSYDWVGTAAEALKIRDPDKLTSCMIVNGMFERLHACMGMEEAMIALLEEPEACREFANAVADHKIAMMERCRTYFKADLINMHDDYGSNQGPLMSLETWRYIFKPGLKRIVEACHEMGMFYQHHSCGFIEPFVEDLVEIGVDAIDTWQVCNRNMRVIKDRFQDRLTFVGGMDNLGILDRPDATDEEIYAELKRAVDLMAPGGSYIPASITLTFRYMPTYLRFMQEYGKDYYRNHPESLP